MPLKRIAINGTCSLLAIVQIFAFPGISLAQEAAPEATTSESTSAPESTAAPGEPSEPRGATDTGPTTPTGADSQTYTQNEDGTWSNGVYTWDPTTKQTKPNAPQEYSYNPSTGMWDTTEYVYSPEQGKYIPNVRSVQTNPNAPAASSAQPLAAANGSGGATISNTGPNSNNSINLGTDTTGAFDLFFNGSISNKLNSSAVTGNALVQGNTEAGSALTGDATVLANIINMLQSSWLGQSSDVASFISNIDGSVYGDLLIDPNALPYNLGTHNSDVDVNISNSGVINNDIDLAARTGNATVDSNTLAGDAASGDARAMANVINMINSAIHAGKSFLGVININGNLDGDILLPPGVLDALIASTGPNSNNTIRSNGSSNVNVNDTANRTINNNVNTAAQTGNANVDSNTAAGNATTGQANTGINSMNVIGQNVKAKNGLLVFVNVLGNWLGLVIGPSGATINNTGPNSNNTIAGGGNNSVTVNSTENSLINNNINVNAQSGNANVTNNTQAGSAKTGDAAATVNLLNMIGSDINVDDWFGVLFINVFGNWFGNFGSDTEHGGFSQNPAPTSTGGGSTTTSTANNNQNGVGQVFGFINRQVNVGLGATAPEQPVTQDQSNNNQAVFGSTTPSSNNGASSGSPATVSSSVNWWVVVGLGGMAAVGIALAREYFLALRDEKQLIA